ncbi:unnamed protein product [Ceutorhynchus assimilis]|uniref:Uncharacterized protein n=1 Tax=Ceutorhynchus assimilis TaxID=467358 RepID=A0A9N9QMR0_9CUCU|nr:unnamed protein product [Ceutorhynchus assimilis]
MEIQKKLQEYNQFVEGKLKPDLRDIESVLTEKSSQTKEWTDLKNTLKVLKEFKEKDRDMNILLDLENNVTAFAKICDYETTYVDIGLDYKLEMNCEEADKYADIRLRLLQKEINHLRELAVKVKVHIKMVLLAMGELQATLNK